ncbi:microtubule organization protein AKNA isoform X2 [Dromaius novaehollandiae]|uniref:microtubule organization protein AKNA isoform X2 n=1 Tax=Dromaius novaehollandiae TaxID=8790 RepID=UPI00311D325B
MASSAPWLCWTEQDLGSGSWEPRHWEEEEEEDFEEHVGENGVIGLEDAAAVARGPRSCRLAEALGRQVLDPAAHAMSFSRWKLQEFGLREPGTDGEDARSPPLGDGEEPGDGTRADLAYWHPRQDVTEEDEEPGSSGDEERPEGPWEGESDGETYPELSYEGQCGSEYSGSPEALPDGPALRGPPEKSLSFSTDGGETSAPSDASPSPSPARQQQPGHRVPGGTSESPGAVVEPVSPCPSGSSPRPSPPAGSGHWSLSRSLLLHLSADDLRDATGIEAEPFPESGAESSGEPPGPGPPAAAGGLVPAGEHRGSGRPLGGCRAARRAAPAALPPELGRQSRSLSPRRPAGARKTKGSPKADGPRAAESPRYGRGPLNYPLPDLSKVEPRVKFDQSYRPPRSRALPAGAGGQSGPVIFKSPAEIVREVLLSSGEGSPPRCPAPAAELPPQFRCPKQATELVQQLQDDYRKLLTKYAAAENTIDQLRLGAKVSLYADLPKPSHSVHMGTVGTGSKVMAFSIPQARAAAISAAPAPALRPSLDGEPAQGAASQGMSPQPRFPPLPSAGCSACPGECRCPGQHPCLGTQLTRTLAGQTRKFQAQVESFEAWVQAGKSTPQEQLQRFRKLKDTQDVLERAYLQAREENRRLQQHRGASGEFDPDRTVEGEIFCLGMRLEELKDRLERAAQSQLSPRSCLEPGSSPDRSLVPLSETRMSSPTPSLQAPTPAARTPYPESPVLQEALASTRPGTGASSASGESEAGGDELPEPVWHKQLQVEEDFGDLLEQYEHFKSLPASLSLEQLSLAGSRSPEETDGPAAEESGLGKVSCRTRSLEERTDLRTSSLQPPDRRAGPLPRREHPRPAQKSGRLPSAGNEEPLAAATTAECPAGLPEPPRLRAPLSRRSSRADSAASQCRLRERCRPAKPAQAEEQRIVSPETDSGFVGSEASRVSPLMHTPEHRPPGAGTPGSLGRSGPVSTPAALRPLQKSEAAPLPSGKALMGTYTTSGHGPPRDSARGTSLPPSTPSQTSSPPRWAESVASEMAPDVEGTHTDSEAEGRSCASAYSHPPGKTGGPAGLATTMLSPTQAHHDLLGSRMERDRAIRALRDEVSRLQQRLEESLHRSRSYPEGKASLRTATAQRQTTGNGPSPKDAAPSEELSAAARGKPAPATKPVPRGRSASLPRDRPELDLTSESDRLPSKPRDGRPRAALSPRKSPRSPPDAVTFRGQYTGTRYHATPLASPAPRGEPGTPSCPRCCGSHPPSASSSVGDAVRQSQQSTPRKTRCPTCHAPRDAPAPNPRDRAAHAERSSDGTSSPSSRVGPRAEKLEQPGLWYLAASPAAAAVGYLAPVPLVPYAPSVLYCSPVVSTSAPALAGLPLHHAAGYRLAERTPRATRQQAASHRYPLSLDLDDLEDLNWSLSRAVEAAKSMKFTTKQMSRSLTSELSKARDLRGSCLF